MGPKNGNSMRKPFDFLDEVPGTFRVRATAARLQRVSGQPLELRTDGQDVPLGIRLVILPGWVCADQEESLTQDAHQGVLFLDGIRDTRQEIEVRDIG